MATVELTNGQEGLEVACVSTPQTGHLLPTLHIAIALAKRGHHVRVCTCDWADAGVKATAARSGVEVVELSCGPDASKERIEEGEAAGGAMFCLLLDEPMRAPLRAAFAKRRPDVLVADFSAFAGMAVAEEMGVPLVINLPGPVRMLKDMSGCMDGLTHRSFMGLHVGFSSLGFFALLKLLNVRGLADCYRHVDRHLALGALLLVNTFWGLEPAEAVPPNLVVTGPVLPPAIQLASALASKDLALSEFLDRAGERGAVFVTTGSLARLKPWQVEALYHGLKKVGCKVVWSLKAEEQQYLPDKDDADFCMRAWVPQAELLQHDAIRAVVTHCGWGGTLECIIGSKPVVAMPFFGDQPLNAKLLIEVGMAEPIGKVPKSMGKDQNPYRPGDVTPESVRKAVAKVLGDGSYKAAASRLDRCARASGGADAACRHIESAAKFGTAHLLPPNYAQTTGSSAYVGLLVASGLLGAICLGAAAVSFWRFLS